MSSETTDKIMEQAQEFASTWALVGGRFDNGDMFTDAEQAKCELRSMVEAALAGSSSEPPRTVKGDGVGELPGLDTSLATFYRKGYPADYVLRYGKTCAAIGFEQAVDLLTSQGWVQAADALRANFLGGKPGRAAP